MLFPLLHGAALLAAWIGCLLFLPSCSHLHSLPGGGGSNGGAFNMPEFSLGSGGIHGLTYPFASLPAALNGSQLQPPPNGLGHETTQGVVQ